MDAPVSILVFVELALERSTRILAPRDMSEFQSLFLWNWRSNQIPAIIVIIPPSFNPCFCGTGARTSGCLPRYVFHDLVSILVFVELALEHEMIDGHRPIQILFQSLFLWNWRSNDIDSIWRDARTFVSILVFVELALELYCGRLRIGADTWFQSLFLWNWRSNSGESNPDFIPILVSILVFVELALEPFM